MRLDKAVIMAHSGGEAAVRRAAESMQPLAMCGPVFLFCFFWRWAGQSFFFAFSWKSFYKIFLPKLFFGSTSFFFNILIVFLKLSLSSFFLIFFSFSPQIFY